MNDTITVPELLKTVQQRQPCTRKVLYGCFRDLGIQPAPGKRRRPRHYPADSVLKILVHLGEPKIISLQALRAVRKRTRRAR